MRSSELVKIVAGIIAAFGGGAVIVAGASSWLGKLWAERLMAAEKSKHEREMAALTAQLTRENDLTGQTLREKISLYKEASKPLIDLIASYEVSGNAVTTDALNGFEHKRLETSALLGMFAPQAVFEAYNDIIDYIYDCSDGRETYQFSRMRVLGFRMLTEIRKDVGIGSDDLVYRGTRQ